jgi:hypothetical protein
LKKLIANKAHKHLVLLLVLTCKAYSLLHAQPQSKDNSLDPLPSWNEGKVKQAIIEYVSKVTDSASGSFIPSVDRIATFDNDGTLWAERPYIQELFTFYQAKKMAQKNPSLKTQQPFKAVVENDTGYLKKGGQKIVLQLLMATHTGMTEDDFESSVKDFFSTAIYPGSRPAG